MTKKVRLDPRLLTISALIIGLLAAACAKSPTATVGDEYTASGTGGLTAAFLGQDGNSVAGRLCASGTAKDNVHIHLSGLLTSAEPVSFRIEDYSGGGLWATPCDPVSNWFLYVELVKDNETNLFFKPPNSNANRWLSAINPIGGLRKTAFLDYL